MSTVFVQTLFCPDEKRYERNLNSIKSFVKYYVDNKLDIPCFWGGWGDNKYFSMLLDYLTNVDFPINNKFIQKFNKNYGKAVTVNTLIETVNKKQKKYDYILTSDADILFNITEPNIIERLEYVAKISEEIHNKPFGVIGLNQYGDSHHRPKTFEIEKLIETPFGKEKISWGRPNLENAEPYDCATHIAGGCIFVSRTAWEKVGGYRVMGVYAGDDTYLMKDLGEGGFNYQLIQTVNICHPPENDEEYRKWKEMTTLKYSGIRRKNIDNIIHESDNFWENKQRK